VCDREPKSYAMVMQPTVISIAECGASAVRARVLGGQGIRKFLLVRQVFWQVS